MKDNEIKDHWLTRVTTDLLNLGVLIVSCTYLWAWKEPPLIVPLLMLLILFGLSVFLALFETIRKSGSWCSRNDTQQ